MALAVFRESNDKVEMRKISSRSELEDWLKTQGRPDFAQVIASRAALLVLPYAFSKNVSTEWLNRFAMSLFRANAISWAARNFPKYDMLSAANSAAVHSANATAAYAGMRSASKNWSVEGDYSARSVEAAYFAAAAARSSEADAAYAAARSAAALAGAWENISGDCQWLENHADRSAAARRLTQKKLWRSIPPEGWTRARQHAFARLQTLDQGYEVWIEWYKRRERGERAAFDIQGDKNRPEDKAILARLANVTDQKFWGEGATFVNRTLQTWIDTARNRVTLNLLTDEKIETKSVDATNPAERIDFFISYSNKDEATAREVQAILSDRGYTSIAQFKNFQQGNFVREMREGIASADRFIALQSKSYWESDHCQSEWDAAYARDPGAKQRKIVPFLLEPTPLPPIASEVVYQPLFNLNEMERRKAIIAWIEYQPPSRSPQELRKTLAEQSSPDVGVRDEKIDAGPNILFDKPLVDMDLAELPSNLRALLKVLLGSLPNNAPLVVRHCLNGYNEHLLERGAQPIVGTIDPFAAAVRAQIVADAGLWDAGLESLFESFFKRHELLITHFPLNPQRELLIAETPIDEVLASGDNLLDPVEAVSEAMEALKSADLTTEDFNRVEEAHKAFSKDIASLPMPKPTDDVTPKRRYVLGTIGFYERLLAALGAAAGIAATPQGQVAIAAVSGAIETFMSFIL